MIAVIVTAAIMRSPSTTRTPRLWNHGLVAAGSGSGAGTCNGAIYAGGGIVCSGIPLFVGMVLLLLYEAILLIWYSCCLV